MLFSRDQQPFVSPMMCLILIFLTLSSVPFLLLLIVLVIVFIYKVCQLCRVSYLVIYNNYGEHPCEDVNKLFIQYSCYLAMFPWEPSLF